VYLLQPPQAGGSLFHWQDRIDCDIVQNGPYQLRILEAPLPMPKLGIQPSLRKFIHQLRGTDDSKYLQIEQSLDNVAAAFTCNGCRQSPITDPWYHCGSCGDYDLCADCYALFTAQARHAPEHIFAKRTNPTTTTTTTTTTSRTTSTTLAPVTDSASSDADRACCIL
jgi:hypothetical protein